MGPQNFSDSELEEENKRCPKGGFCVAWSILYALVRIMNYKWSRESAIGEVLKTESGESRNSKIRRFQSFIDEVLLQ